MWSSNVIYICACFTIIKCQQVVGENEKQPKQILSRNNDDPITNSVPDSISEADENHKVIILIPHIVKKESKGHHHHDKIPVVHSGKVIHAHHHHGKVDHVHGHSGKGTHHHKHTGSAAHKHNHFGVGMHQHKHFGQGMQVHKHTGHSQHAHKHQGHGKIHHFYPEHHPVQPPKPQKPKKLTYPYYGFGARAPTDHAASFPNSDVDILNFVHPNVAKYKVTPNSGKVLRIRMPDDDTNIAKEIDINTNQDVAIFRQNYLAQLSDDEENEYVANADLTNLDDVDDNGGAEYQFGDGYLLAASAAVKAPEYMGNQGEDVSEQNRNNVIAYSDTYRYQF